MRKKEHIILYCTVHTTEVLYVEYSYECSTVDRERERENGSTVNATLGCWRRPKQPAGSNTNLGAEFRIEQLESAAQEALHRTRATRAGLLIERARHAEEQHRHGKRERTRALRRRARLARLRVERRGLLRAGRRRLHHRLLARRSWEHAGRRLGQRRQVVQLDHVVVGPYELPCICTYSTVS